MKKMKTLLMVVTIILAVMGSTVSTNAATTTLNASTIVNYANSLAGTTNKSYAGLCLKFCFSAIYKPLGATSACVGNGGACCAAVAGNKLIVSSSRSGIPLGSLVFLGGSSSQGKCGTCSNRYGHVGIYVGDDYIVSIRSSGAIKKEKISDWESWGYAYRGWGYAQNLNIVQDSSIGLIQLWGINNGDSFSGQAKLWAKRNDSDTNHYAVFYLDGQAVTGHLSADTNGYFSFYLDTGEYANGPHTLKVVYVNTNGSESSERTINISNTLNFCGFETNNKVGGTRKIQLTTNGYSQSIKIYIDDTYFQTVSKGADGYYTFWLDTCQYSQSMHKVSAKVSVNTGDIESAVCYMQFSQEYILAIDSPSNNLVCDKGDYITVSGWMNDSAQGDFYIDGNLVKTVKGSELFYRSDIGYAGGYSFVYDTSDLRVGNHVISLRASTHNRIAWDSRTFTIKEDNTSNQAGNGQTSAVTPDAPTIPDIPITPTTPDIPTTSFTPNTPNVSGSTEKTDNSPIVGTVVTYEGIKYKVMKNGKDAYVECIGPANKSIKKATIYSVLILKTETGSYRYPIRQIKNDAFKNCTKLKSVTIGKNVKTIGKKAFYGCKKLKNVIIQSQNLTSVKSKAFKGIYKKAKINVPNSKKTKYKKLLKKAGVKSVAVIK